MTQVTITRIPPAKIITPQLLDYAQKDYYRNPARDAYYAANIGIDPAILAWQTNHTESFVMMRQRKAGVRKCKFYRAGDRKKQS